LDRPCIELAFDAAQGEVSEDDQEEPGRRRWHQRSKSCLTSHQIQIINCECIEINTGEVERMAEAIREVTGVALAIRALQEKAVELYKRMKREEAERFNERSAVEQWRQAVEHALSVVARRAAR
jgi:uncharacterized protein YgbK (DUF1537 family)